MTGDEKRMVDNIKLRIIESHEQILNIIDKNIGTLVNFDWHSDYPLYAEKTLDVDSYSSMILNSYPSWLDNNWATVLASKGYMSQYVWLYPHDCGKDDIKIFKSKKGDCLVYNVKFNRKTKISYKYITIDMDFIGCRVPMIWNPDDRAQLFADAIECLTARNITLIISKSRKYINYDIDVFLDNIMGDLSDIANVEMI